MQAVTSINGVLINKINLEHKGTYTVTGNNSGYAAKMKLHASGMLTSKSKMHEASSLLLKRLFRSHEHPGRCLWNAQHVLQKKYPSAGLAVSICTSWQLHVDDRVMMQRAHSAYRDLTWRRDIRRLPPAPVSHVQVMCCRCQEWWTRTAAL